MNTLRLAQVARLSARDWCTLAHVAGCASLIEVGLRVLPLPRLCGAVGIQLATDERQPTGSRETGLTRRELRQIALARRIMQLWPWGDTCLRVALVSGRLLRVRRPLLCVGVARVDGTVRAHAWLEVNGVSLDPVGSAMFSVLTSVGES